MCPSHKPINWTCELPGSSSTSEFDPRIFSDSIRILNRNTTEDQCETLIETLQSSEFFLAFWNIFRHLIEGKIVYYPKTSVTEDIMKRANETFETLGKIKALGQDQAKLQKFSSRLSEVFEISTEKMENFIEIPLRLIDCVDLDKMTGFELGREEEYSNLVDDLMCDTKNQNRKKNECKPTLWAVIEFRDKENQELRNESTLEHVTYTIRMPRNQVQGKVFNEKQSTVFLATNDTVDC